MAAAFGYILWREHPLSVEFQRPVFMILLIIGDRDRGGQNVPNARGGGGNSPRKLSLESLDF